LNSTASADLSITCLQMVKELCYPALKLASSLCMIRRFIPIVRVVAIRRTANAGRWWLWIPKSGLESGA